VRGGEEDRSPRNARRALASAIGLHAALLAALVVSPLRRATPQPRLAPPASEIAIELDAPPETTDPGPGFVSAKTNPGRIVTKTNPGPVVTGTNPVPVVTVLPAPTVSLAARPNAFVTAIAKERPTLGLAPVVSTWKMPSGHDPGVDVSLLGLPLQKGEGKQSTKVEVLPLPKITTVDLAKDVPIPIPMISVDALAVHGDPADIGAKPRRVVHTRLLDAKVL
jgi:hypothetical protein